MTTIRIMTVSIRGLIKTIRIIDKQLAFHIVKESVDLLNAVVRSVIMLSIAVLSTIILSAIVFIIIMLSVIM